MNGIYKWATGVIHPINGVITPSITGRGQLCGPDMVKMGGLKSQMPPIGVAQEPWIGS